MSDAIRKFFSGKTVEQAVLLAASHYGLRTEEVRFREVEKRHGFTRTPKNVVIAVDPDNPRLGAEERADAQRARSASTASPPASSRDRRPAGEGASSAPAARGERGSIRGREERGGLGGRPDRGGRGGDRQRSRGAGSGGSFGRAEPSLLALPVSPVKRAETMRRAEGPQAESARRALELLLGFVGIEAEADLLQGPDRFEVELWGPDDRVLLEDEGRVLLAIEHLVPRMMRGLDAEPIPVRVDCDNFHMIREERLRDLAQRVAAEVRRTGRHQILDELDPSERRIIHVTLKDDPGVSTESLGDGYFKRLKVMLSEPPEEVSSEEGEA